MGFGDGAEFLSCAYFFFIGFFEYFFQDEKGNFTVRNCDFDFNYNSCEKLLVMYLNGVKNFVYNLYLPCMHLFLAPRSSECFSFYVFML